MAVVEKRPFWFDHFQRLVEKCWDHRGPCKTFHLQSALEVEMGRWLFRAAPVFQEIYGGKDDGKTVWTKFEFHTDKLMRAMNRAYAPQIAWIQASREGWARKPGFRPVLQRR